MGLCTEVGGTTPRFAPFPGGLSPSRLQLWWADLDAPPIDREQLECFLLPLERDRARRLPNPISRSRWVAARGLLRHLLGAISGVAPQKVALRSSPREKPFITGSDLSFNLSHSGPHLLIAVAPSGRVGVDVEVVRPVNDLQGLVRHFFAAGEIEALLGGRSNPSGDKLLLTFFRTWTRKEALIKGVGWGVGAPLDAFEVHTGPGRDESDPAASSGNLLITNSLPGEADSPWQLRSAPSPSGTVAAVAWDAPELAPAASANEWPLNGASA